MLNVEDISYDRDNPRIKKALEKWGDQINAQRISFALHSANGGSSGVPSYDRLRDSIRASSGIVVPITVTVNKDGGYVCIDGNTRLAIYKEFLQRDVSGDWTQIKSVVLDPASRRDIETIRVTAHLVGPRDWPAYEKARYLHHLRNQEFMDYEEMIALCGGNRRDIERQIDAYHDMNEYYRDVVEDDSFRIDRFSGFVELQKPKIKDAIFDAGCDLKDFGEWIRDGKIYRLEDVRNLPKVLQDEEAKEVFLAGEIRSIEDAIRVVEKRQQTEPGSTKLTLKTASMYHLAVALNRRITDLPYSELRALKAKENNETIEQIRALEGLSESLDGLLKDVSE